MTPGEYAVMCISDSGAGMDAGTLERVFEPFFTTKEVGKGTGLGLSMVYGFIKQSGGHVKLYSEPGEGTTVKIYLPRLASARAASESEERPAAAPEGGDGTIIVCEDDDEVRAYTVEALTELGCRVIEAGDGPAALERLGEASEEARLLFTDVVLPGGMNGAILAERARPSARAIRPDLKILFTSGYARSAIVHAGRLDPGVELISKPFSYGELARRIRAMLDERPGGEG
ncbi:MAG: ATP-binding protein [Sphingomonadaceae bacterium]